VKRATIAFFLSSTILTLVACTHSARTAALGPAVAQIPVDDHVALRTATLYARRSVVVSRSFHRTAPAVVRRAPVVQRLVRHRVTTSYSSSSASQMASMIESARSSHGLRILGYNSSLASSSRAHSAAMARDDRLYHSSQSELWADAGRACGSCTTAGEIIGMGTSVRQIFNAFMADSVHRSEILNRSFRYFGVGVVYARGAYWVTVQFAG
jgi:uncharacterized protein YkwD